MNRVMAALITPFDDAGRVDFVRLRQVLRHELWLGIRCFYVCGTTGEGLSMSAEERKAVVEAVVQELGSQQQGRGAFGVIVNISHMEFAVALDLARHAARVRADAVSTLPPLFYPVSPREVELYYRRFLEELELPLTIYNIPMLSGRALDEAMAVRLAGEYPNFAGIKHSSEDTFVLNRFKQIDNGRLMVWSGRDAYYLGALAMGADGAIGNSFNLMGDLFIRITQLYRAGRVAEALEIQRQANEVHRRLQVFGGTQSVKRCLKLLGVDAGGCRLPYQPLPVEAEPLMHETVQLLREIRDRLGKTQG
jgi:N-acetylneuraminate lyase